jgi:hypothetical protein
MIDANTRKIDVKPTRKRKTRRLENAYLQYNGGCREYEDLADYLPRLSLRGVVIA